MSSALAEDELATRSPACVGSEACPAAVSAELDAIADALGRLREVEWWRIGDGDVLAAAQRVEAVLRSGFGVQVRLAGEINGREMTAWTGHRSTAGLLSEMLRIPVGQARGRVDAARLGAGSVALSGEPLPAAAPELMTAIDSGAISDEHAAVISRCVDGIPATVDGETAAMCLNLLLSEAQQRHPVALRTVAEQIRLICDDAGSPPGPDPVNRAELYLGALRADGLTPLRGLLDPLTAEHLRVAVEALAAPKPIDDHTPDPRPAGLRRAQALGEVLARYFAAGCSGGAGPGARSVRPVVAVTVPASLLPGGPYGADLTDRGVSRPAGAAGNGHISAAGSGRAGASGAASTGVSGSRCTESARERQVAAASPAPVPGLPRQPTADDGSRRPSDGDRGQVLFAGPGGRFDYGSPAPARAVGLLACDGVLIRQIVGDGGAVLDQGLGQRLFTRAQRRALATRDRGCAFPGCDIPAGWCEAHHITPWSEDGPTDLANGVLLCRRHHTVIHQGRWRIDPPTTRRGRPWFIPPAHIDVDRTPRRNHHFHLPVVAAAVMRT